MDLLTIVKIYLFLGSVCYMLTVLSFIRRHTPKIMLKSSKKEIKEKEEDGRNKEE
mgnify:CR=1 FL=1